MVTVFLLDIRSCCGCSACRSWWRRWRPRLSAPPSTAPTTRTAPSRTTRTCGCLEGDTSTGTSSARTNMSNTTSTPTCRTSWVSAHFVFMFTHICRRWNCTRMIYYHANLMCSHCINQRDLLTNGLSANRPVRVCEYFTVLSLHLLFPFSQVWTGLKW